MRRVVIAVLLSLAAAGTAASSAPAATGDLVIASRGFGVTVLGPMRPRSDATKEAAIRAFGSSYRIGTRCRYSWPAIGLTLHIENLGVGEPCKYAQLVTISGRPAPGLRVGSSLTTLRRLYPRAAHHGALWTLAAARSPFGDRQVVAVVWAVVSRGRVSAIRGWVGGAGE